MSLNSKTQKRLWRRPSQPAFLPAFRPSKFLNLGWAVSREVREDGEAGWIGASQPWPVSFTRSLGSTASRPTGICFWLPPSAFGFPLPAFRPSQFLSF
jgi:hypothetical protein